MRWSDNLFNSSPSFPDGSDGTRGNSISRDREHDQPTDVQNRTFDTDETIVRIAWVP
jgi:hypothetical protein